jgi:hypothetical protein
VEQLDRLSAGRDAKLVVQGSDAESILTAHKLLLMFPGETPHEKPVCGLTAPVGTDGELGEPHSGGKIGEINISLCQVLQCLKIQFLQMALFGQVPFTGRIILEEFPAVELDGPLIGVDGLLVTARTAG